jgi:AcrR family transcriptional regulator
LYTINNPSEQVIKRTRKFEAIVSAAQTLFWKHGIRRVTIGEICREAGVCRATCYKYFNDKTAIAKFIIEDMFENEMKAYMEIINTNVPYEEKVKMIIDLKIKNTFEISQELINEIFQNREKEISDTFEKAKNKMLAIYLDDFRKAKKAGEIRTDIKPEFIMYFINHLPKMIIDEELVGMYPDPEKMIAEIFSFFFYGILPGKNRKSK